MPALSSWAALPFEERFRCSVLRRRGLGWDEERILLCWISLLSRALVVQNADRAIWSGVLGGSGSAEHLGDV
ncbi:hypothetical protein GQ53DRAFT_755191 [Thozetella sp. PMI_491]|nr:hypothetical protein GQ53DRAFT_755191 [Thozetella sp. PMI_491]